MFDKLFLHKVFVIVLLFTASFSLAACKGKGQAKVPNFPSTEFTSPTELINLYIPSGWSVEEVIPGADLVIANTGEALEHYRNGSTPGSGEIVMNIGFLPLALFQEKELAHLGIKYDAAPDIFLQSILPMFRVGNEPASVAAGKAMLVSLSDGRDAGILSLSDEESEGIIMVFTTGKDVFAFISVTTYPGGLQEYQEVIYAVSAGVSYNGSQDALYSKLYGD